MSKTVQEIMEVIGKTVEVTMKLERKNGSSYAHIADITPEDINEIRYYFDGALYRSVMRCLEVKLKGDWTAKSKKGLLLDSLNLTVTHPEGDRATIGYGGFYIAEAPEYDAAQNLTSIIAYDELYLSMQPYTASLWQSGITVKNYLIAILNKLGINYDTNSLSLMANADKKITSEKFLDIENDSTEAAYTYRDILDEIAKASGVTFAFKNSLGGDPFKLYCIKPTESGYVIDESNLRSVTIGARYGPVKGVVLSREPQEDNVIYPSNLTDSQTAVKISNVEIMEDSGNDAYRETFIQGIYNNVKNTEYYLYDLDSFGIGFLNFGDIFTLKVCERKNGEIGDEKEYKTIFMRADMTVGDGIKEKSKLEAPQATSTDYAAASTTDKALKKTMLKVDKQEQRITALVKESDARYSEFTQTAEGLEGTIADVEKGLEAKIEATAKSFELTYAKKETVDGQIEGITNQIGTINTELAGIDGKIAGKVTTEVQKDTTIAILAGKVESKISGNYVTKATYDDEKQNWLLKTTYDSYVKQTDQQISAAVSKVQKLEQAGYITKAACNSLIDQKSDSIALKVESSIKTESRNLLKNSACFENFTTNTYNSYFDGFESGTNPYVAKDQTTLPSGQAQRILFMSNNETVSGFKYAGSAFVEAALGSKNAGNVLKPKTTYTLSFWARMYDSGTKLKNRATLNLANAVYTGTGANSVTIDSTRSRGASLTNSFSKVVIVFTTGGAIETFQLNFRLEGIPVGYVAGIIFSSLKLEVGNIATDWTEWTPTAADVEQSAQAKIDMCVQKDKNNNLVSEINIASNLLTIDTDNFTLAKDGTMSCTGATITGGTILCGDTNTSMLIAQGAIVHKFDGTEIGQIGLTMNPDSSGNMQYYERISGTVGVQISANNYATFVDDAGFVVCSNARDTTINVSISSTTDWSYASYSSALRSIVEADAALIVSANRGNNNLYLEGSSVVICGQLEALNDVKLRTAIGLSSSQSYVYVVADKKTGEIGYLSA